MSTNWGVKCLDCNEVEIIDDWRIEKTMALVKHAASIGALAGLIAEWPDIGLVLGTQHQIPIHFFAEHATHRLVPCNECGANVRCPGSICRLPPKHVEPHNIKRPS